MADTAKTVGVADGGWGWMVLIGAFITQVIYAGTVFSVGIYMVEWQRGFSVGAAAVSIVATELTCCINIATSVSGALCKRYGCRPVMMIGGALVTISTFLASFATELWHIYICFCVAGFGHGTCFIVSVTVTQFYFKRKLAFANGLVCAAGSGAGLVVMSPIIEHLCAEYGWQGSLQIHSAILANLLVCGALLRPSALEQQVLAQYNTSQTNPQDALHLREASNDTDTKHSPCFQIWRTLNEAFALSSLVTNRLYLFLALLSILIMGAYVSSLVFLIPKLVYDSDFSNTSASIALSIFGAFSVLSGIFHGLLIDFKLMTVTNLYLLSLAICGISTMLLPPVMSAEGQFVLTGIFGAGSGVLVAMTPTMCRQYVPIDKVSNALGFLFALATIGLLLGTQMMGKVFDAFGSYSLGFYINGSLFLGATAVMVFVTKCSCWRESRLLNPMGEIDHNEFGHVEAIAKGETVANLSSSKDIELQVARDPLLSDDRKVNGDDKEDYTQ